MASSAGLSISVLLLLLCSLPNTALGEDTCRIQHDETSTRKELTQTVYTFSVQCGSKVSNVSNVTATLTGVNYALNAGSPCTVRYVKGKCFKSTSPEVCPCVPRTTKFSITGPVRSNGTPRLTLAGWLINNSRFRLSKDIQQGESPQGAADSSTASPQNLTTTASHEDQGIFSGFLAEAGVALIITICASLATVAIVFFLLVCLCRRRKKTAGVTKRRGADASCNDVIRRVPAPSVMIDNCMYGASPPEDYSDVIDRVNPLNSLQTASRYGNKKSEYDEVDVLGDYVDVPITCND